MPPHASPRVVRSRLRSGLALLAAVAFLAGCGKDSGTGPSADTPAPMTLDVTTASPGRVVFAHVAGATIPTTPVAGRLGTAPVTATRLDDSTLAVAVPAVVAGSYELRLAVGARSYVADLAVGEPVLVAAPTTYVGNTLASVELQLDVTLAGLDAVGAEDSALFAGLRQAIATAREQFAALSPSEQAQAASMIAANAAALGLEPSGAMRLVQSGSMDLQTASLVEARCKDADGNTLESYEDCKASLTAFLSKNRTRIKKIAITLIALKVAAAAGGPLGIAIAGVSAAIAATEVAGLAYESYQRFVVPQFRYFRSEEFWGSGTALRAAGQPAGTRTAAATAPVPEFVNGVARPVTLRAVYQSPVRADASTDAIVAGAVGVLDDIAGIWNEIAQYLPGNLSLPTIASTPAQVVEGPVPAAYLAVGATSPSSVTAASLVENGAWSLRFASAGIGNDLPFTFALRHVVNGVADRTETVSAMLKPAQYAVASVTVTPADPLVQKGATLALAIEARDSAGRVITGQPVAWSSSNTSVARVDAAGVVTGVEVGTAFVNGSVGGKTGIVMVKVWAPSVASVTITPQSPTVTKGQTVQLAATLKDSVGNVLAGTVTWSSANTARATVDAAGLVTGVDTGTVAITATAANGKSATVQLRVDAVATWRVVDLGTDYNDFNAWSVNDSSWVVGQRRMPDNSYHVVLWRNGVVTDLGIATRDVRLFINNAGEVAGMMPADLDGNGSEDGAAFRWRAGSTQVLPLPAGWAQAAGWTIQDVLGVQEDGTVVARALYRPTSESQLQLVMLAWDRAGTPRVISSYEYQIQPYFTIGNVPALAANGAIVGALCQPGGTSCRAARWENGTVTPFASPTSGESQAWWIDPTGTRAVGWVTTANGEQATYFDGTTWVALPFGAREPVVMMADGSVVGARNGNLVQWRNGVETLLGAWPLPYSGFRAGNTRLLFVSDNHLVTR